MQLEKYKDDASMIAFVAGFVLFLGCMFLPIRFQTLHMGLAILIGIVVAGPFFYLAIRLSPESPDGPKPFLPSGEEARAGVWKVALFLTWGMCFIGPITVLLAIGSLLPAGDNWPNVITRLGYAACAIAAMSWWFPTAQATVPNWFRGKIADEHLRSLIPTAEPVVPKSALQAARGNWQLLVIAALAFCVGLGVIDLNHPIFKIDDAPKRGRAVMQLLLWCRGNPNTVHSSGILVGVASIGYFAYTIFKAARVRPS